MISGNASERVEVTPELLDANWSAAATAIEAGVRVIGIHPETVMALVERIRELERKLGLPDLPGKDEMGVTLEQFKDGDLKRPLPAPPTECPHCHKWFNAKGMHSHKRACPQRLTRA